MFFKALYGCFQVQNVKCYFLISSPKLRVVSLTANQIVLINVNSVNDGRIFKI